ncbi:MAG: insulinase family protein [Rhodospirillaceae bacterium]|jgi:zinc protease|nr:insulinase family protein [Rhodospirillaceae bacterium]
MKRFFFISVLIAAWSIAGTANAVDVQRVISPGGIEAWLVHDDRNPIINLRFTFRGGAALDPIGKEGLANLVSSTLDEGAGNFDSKAFQQTLEDKAISLGFDAGKDTFGGHLRTLTQNRDQAFGLLKIALTRPRFDPEPLSRIRTQILIGLKQDKEDPGAIANRKLMQTLFPDHPYGRATNGTEESVKSIATDDLHRFVKRRLARDNLLVGAVGDVTPEMLGKLLDDTFGRLPAKAAPWALPQVTPATTGKTIVIEKNVPQSKLAFADQGLKREDPDFYAAYVMNRILGGGGFTSRLYAEVREKRGLAYSVHSNLYPFDASAMLLGGAGTANARVGETIEVIADEWQRMAEHGVSDAELNDARTYLTGAFPLRFSSSGRIARMLVGMQISGLEIDYLQKRNSFIEAVTRPDITRVAKKLLDTKRLTTVVVGKPDGVRASD